MGRLTQNPSLQLIADRAGVSRSTVSLALRNQQCIAQATRDRIHQVAREAGYRPNPLVSTLMAHIKSQRPLPDVGAIGFITSFSTRDEWRQHPYFLRCFNGASERASQLGYHLDEMWLREPGMTARKMESILYNRGVDGLLVAPLPSGGGHLSLDIRRFAAATLGFSLVRPNLHRASSNHSESIRLTIRTLRHRGYRRLALVVTTWQDRRSNSRWTAEYLSYQQSLHPSARIPIQWMNEMTDAQVRAWLDEWKPDAILSSNAEFLSVLKRLKVSVPDDIGVAVLDRAAADTHVSGIDLQPEFAAAAAVDLIIGQLQRNERGVPAVPKLTMVGGAWIEGETVRKPASTLRLSTRAAAKTSPSGRRPQIADEPATASPVSSYVI